MELFNKNVKWCEDNFSRCEIEKKVIFNDVSLKLYETKDTSFSSLSICIENKETLLHSKIHPILEAQKIVDNFDINNANTIIIIGFGLGYVAKAFRDKYPNKKLLLIEPDINVFYKSLEFIDLNYLNFQKIFVGINEIQLHSIFNEENLFDEQFSIFVFKPQEKCYNNYFLRILKILNKENGITFSDDWKYRKFTNANCRILFIDSSYVLTKECLNAIKNTGNDAYYLHIDLNEIDYEIFIRNLLNAFKEFKPDFVLTINHLGFDTEGRLTEIFNSLELPFVSWFVDSPNVILSSYLGSVSDYCNIFIWEQDYISEVVSKGYKHCNYLPLATDLSIFKNTKENFLYDVSFVGSSMVYATHKNMISWVHRDDLISEFIPSMQHFLFLKTRKVEKVIDFLSNKNIIFDSEDQKNDFLAAVLWKATMIYRLSGIKKLADFKPVIAGDPNWSNILAMQYQILPERWYYDNLVDFYNLTKINFNMTSLQMTNAINQRIFDVSACQKFILTDYRPQIDELFFGRDNIAFFTDVNEISDLVKFYLNNENLRNKMCLNAYEIVSKYHTYNHRIIKIIETLRNKFS
jgi:spore maturation protein CgeB